jgi:hypothetical protein
MLEEGRRRKGVTARERETRREEKRKEEGERETRERVQESSREFKRE